MGFLVILIPVLWISVLVACYSEASIVNREMLEITTLQRVSKYKMYSPIFLEIKLFSQASGYMTSFYSIGIFWAD
jgi:hypothetical protein